ncbi:MAG: chorismate mutase [Cyanobacteria bacterium REEB65]|nr:chorismate mutase [Cyanobacteria bacterium REEB65]
MRAIRGATTVEGNTRDAILSATADLLGEIVAANGLTTDDLVSVLFTMTSDLDAVFPAEAARQLGWSLIPLLCASEIPVPGSLPHCIRVLVHVDSTKPQSALCHVYLRDAAQLRPDLASAQ